MPWRRPRGRAGRARSVVVGPVSPTTPYRWHKTTQLAAQCSHLVSSLASLIAQLVLISYLLFVLSFWPRPPIQHSFSRRAVVGEIVEQIFHDLTPVPSKFSSAPLRTTVIRPASRRRGQDGTRGRLARCQRAVAIAPAGSRSVPPEPEFERP